jgi:hypothetical protein
MFFTIRFWRDTEREKKQTDDEEEEEEEDEEEEPAGRLGAI